MGDAFKLNEETGKVEIDLELFVDQLSQEGKLMLRKYLVSDQFLINAVIDALVTGEQFEGWWFSTDTVDEWRAKLQPMMPEVIRKLVVDLIRARTQADERAKHYRDTSFQLSRYASDVILYHFDRGMNAPVKRYDWKHVPFDEDAADKLIADALEKAERGEHG